MKVNVISPEFYKKGRTTHHINSFVRHQRRLTKRQQYALDNYWPIIGVNFKEHPIDYVTLFGCKAPITLEIGFGMGSSLVATAKMYPNRSFLGIEVYSPGVGACLAMAYEKGVKNIRVIYHDAIEVLYKMISDNSLSIVQLFFPDPWHKKRHNKRRILQIPFARLVKNKLKINGIFHIATDCQTYAEHMLKVMSSIEGYKNHSESNDYVSRPESRPITKFEYRSQYNGYKVLDLIFEKIK